MKNRRKFASKEHAEKLKDIKVGDTVQTARFVGVVKEIGYNENRILCFKIARNNVHNDTIWLYEHDDIKKVAL